MTTYSNKLNLDELCKLLDLPTQEELDEANCDNVWEAGNAAYGEVMDQYKAEAAKYGPDATEGDGPADDSIARAAAEVEAEVARQVAEQAEQTDIFHKWHNAVMEAAERTFSPLGLELVPVAYPRGQTEYAWEHRVEAARVGGSSSNTKGRPDWKRAAAEILDAINGVGYFHFNTLREFLASGPYTPRQAVLGHLHYARRRAEVYGDPSPRSVYERAWR